MTIAVVLVVLLGGVESRQGNHLSHDECGKNLRLIQLLDVCLGDPFLLRVRVKDHGSILRSDIGSLAVQLRRIVCDLKKDVEQLPIGTLRGLYVIFTDSICRVLPVLTIS